MIANHNQAAPKGYTMPKLLLPVFLVLLLAVAFYAGRFTASALLFAPSELLDDPLEQAWDDFIRAQRETMSQFRNSDFFEDDQERAEAFRSLLYGLIGSIKAGALMDHDQPRFMSSSDWTSKNGLDNPDNNYLVALIRDDADYRVIGERGTTANMVFQLLIGKPGVRGAGSSTNVSVLDGADMALAEDGSFEVLISRHDPGPGVNWLAQAEGAETLLVRFTHSDWGAEHAGKLRIEKIGTAGEPAIPLSPARMAKGLQDAAVILFDRNATWLQLAQRGWNLMPRNGISAPQPTRGGLVGQYSAAGSWELDNDKAIILSTAPSAASYQGIELGSLWFTSLNYENRTTSLSLDQMQCSSDGRCYAVISHKDPGIHNWLDTEGHRRGLIFMRWQGLLEDLPESQQPRARLVDFERLRDELPEDVGEFSAEQRRNQIRQRRANLQQRFNG
ncbi:MAG: DUF1214 domain-containing protein [Gammaproteobacteria bacterium]|nr:DUF1214 domain-containing protein [Gammaproteobacteria bacterium]